MIELIKMVDGVARAYSTAAFRAANKHTAYGHAIAARHLAAQDVHRVRAGPKPAEAIGFKVVADAFPTLTSGVWVQAYKSVAISAASARDLRDSLLAETDWTGQSDVTMSAEMTTYRQALRNVPQEAGFPDNITWPTAP